jgi:predicted transcriptional regulator
MWPSGGRTNEQKTSTIQHNKEIIPNISSFLPAVSSACVCLHLLSFSECGITEEKQDGRQMSHTALSLSKFYARRIENRRLSFK